MQKVKFLNREKVIASLCRLSVKAKADDKNIRKIILFGSLVNDTYTTMSDADILVVLEKSELRFMDRIPPLLFRFIDAPITVDVFPYTEEEAKTIPFAKSAISGGITLC